MATGTIATSLVVCSALILLSIYYLGLIKKLGYSKEISGFTAGVLIGFILLNSLYLLIAIPSCLVLGLILAFVSSKYPIELYVTAFLGSSGFAFWFLSWSYPCLFKSLIGKIAFFVIVYISFCIALKHVPTIFPYVCHALTGAYMCILGLDIITNAGILNIFLLILTAKSKIDYSTKSFIPLLIYIVLFFLSFYHYCIRHHPKPMSLIMIQA